MEAHRVFRNLKNLPSNPQVPITTHGANIQLCATIGNFNLTSYGVPESIASTMDRAVQVIERKWQ